MTTTEPAPPATDVIHITVDGKEIEAKKGELVIAAAEREGVYIPRFCYHNRMKPVGMCRMCLVEVEGPRGPALTVSCMADCADGMVVNTMTDTVKKAQDGVLEFLLANHPLDCPVCDKGGECPLQDQTLTFGPGESRFVEEKRHFEKPIPISELVLLDRERCILCDRCTRFSKDVAGDPLIHFTNRGAFTEVATFPEHEFSSYFSGNTVQICPVGALTSTPYRFKARPWDLEQVESTCTSCSVGCRVAVQSSQNKLTRYIGLDSEPVNHSWLCDKGRFDFESVNSENRLRTPQVRKDGELQTVNWPEALDAAAKAITEAIAAHGPGSVAVIGGARLPNEDQYAWAKLAKGIIGTDHVDAQLGDGLPAEMLFSLPRAQIDHINTASSILVLGADIKEELPVLYLRVREAATDKHVPLIHCSPLNDGLAPYATVRLAYTPGEEALLAAALVSDKVPSGAEIAGVPAAEVAKARELLGPNPVVIIGRPTLAVSVNYLVDAAQRLAARGATFLFALRRSNIFGALDAGLVPGWLPGRVSLTDGKDQFSKLGWRVPAERGLDTLGILKAAADGEISTLILVGADPLKDVPNRALADAALERVRRVIAVDTFPNATNEHAHVLLPAATYGERTGTTTNIEGRVSNLGQKIVPPGVAWADWMIAAELAMRLHSDLGAETIDEVWDQYRSVSPMHAHLDRAALNKRSNADGLLTMPPIVSALNGASGEAKGAMRDGYSLRVITKRTLWDGGTLVANSPSLAKLKPNTPAVSMHPSLLNPLGIGEGEMVQLRSSTGTIVVSAHADSSLPKNIAVMNITQEGIGPFDFIDPSEPYTDVKVETPN